MARVRIFCVGFDLPTDDFEHISFDSDQTLLDADVVLFEPSLGNDVCYESYNGKPLLPEHASFSVKERITHWRNEIIAAVNAGKLVIVTLVKPEEKYRYTGDKTYSGTGRSRVTTPHVEPISSYDAVPNVSSVAAKTGQEIRLEKDAGFLAAYWNDFGRRCPYEVEIEGNFKQVLLRSKTGNRVVGAAVQMSPGALLLLPPLRYDKKKFVKYDKDKRKSFWTNEAAAFGKRLAGCVAVLSRSLRQSHDSTPPPVWASESRYRLAKEQQIETEIVKLNSELAERVRLKGSLESQLHEAGGLRWLLFEQGKPLEKVTRKALGALGFQARPFADSESEFDAIFESAEGRCLGEVEGKDNKAINVDKISQLERNLQEDYAKDSVADFAKGVLFGNAFRLTKVEERGTFFTEKCISAAKRAGIALVRTPDLFTPAKYLIEHPDDHEYAIECRQAIYASEGEVAVFPSPPIGEGATGSIGNKADREHG